MIVQIYEIQRAEEAEKCIELGVDHIGSVIPSSSAWRNQDLRDVVRLAERTEVKTSLIPLFQDHDILYRALDYYRPHFVHFCDTLTDPKGKSVDLCPFILRQRNLRERFPEISIIRSIPVRRNGLSVPLHTLEIARFLEPVTDFFLTDTWVPRAPVKGFIGITGQRGDWLVSKDLVSQCKIPVILAGGLSPENVFEALLKVIPYGADSCTLTNRTDQSGIPLRFNKDFQKVGRFVNEIRRFEAIMRLKKKEIKEKLKALRAEISEREAALPPHSIRPHQILAIEALEDELHVKEMELRALKNL